MKLTVEFSPSIDDLTRKLKADIRGGAKAGMTNVVTTVESEAKRNAPMRTSNLKNSGSSFVNADGSRGSITFSAPSAAFVHEGTGLFGPRKTKIVPKTKKALFWPGAPHPMRSVRGMEAQPFLREAAEKYDLAGLFKTGMGNYLARKGNL